MMKDDVLNSPDDSPVESPTGFVESEAAEPAVESTDPIEAPIEAATEEPAEIAPDEVAGDPDFAEDLPPEDEFPGDHGEGSEVPLEWSATGSVIDFPPLAGLLEALFFTSQKPMGVKEILSILKGAASASENLSVQAFGKAREPQIREAVEWLENHYEASGRSFQVRESAAGWQLVTRPDFAPWLRQLFPENRPSKLSAPALETLAIIAYRQPITRADLEAVRGVAVDGVMQTLLDRGLVKIAGRAEVPGRPLLYETTQHFMEHFGLRDLEELPNAQELRTVPLPKAEPAPEEAPAEASTESSTESSAETPVAAEEETTTPTAEETPETEEPVISEPAPEDSADEPGDGETSDPLSEEVRP